jgi:hypothetical protein
MARRPKGDLVAWWAERGEDVPAGGDIKFAWDRHSCDGSLLYSVFCAKRNAPSFNGPTLDPSFVEELKARGYDLRTLRFSIDRRPADPKSEGAEAPESEVTT